MMLTRSNRRLFAAAIMLTVLMILLLPAQKIAAAEEQPRALYISELRLGYGKTAEEAAKSLSGYEILKNDGKYANLNEGSGRDTVVLMGYKTTADRNEAVTDIAAMNMKGGYSFTEFGLLMDQYRDSQIIPFINRFLAAVKEYRKNYSGAHENNQAKAQYAHDMLNLFIDDDTGMGMGDLLLRETAEEFGLHNYEALSDENKKKYGVLSTVLMQGETSIIFMIEQLVTMAADTNETTWLQRFEGVTSDSLLKAEMEDGMGKTDAKKSLARKYEETARLLGEKWLYFRASLLDYDEALKAEDGGVELDPEEAPVPEDEEEETADAQTAKEIMNELSADELVNDIINFSEGQIETAEAIDDVKIAMAYNYLKNTKYGKGTMYDYFTQSESDISKNNYYALYPLVSVLTEGQIAGVDFMNVNQLVQYGLAIGNSYVEMNKRLGDYLKNVNPISVYKGINRDMFSSGTALTDAEMRDKAAKSTQLFGDTAMAAVGRACVFSAIGIASGFGAAYCIPKTWAVLKSTMHVKLTEIQTSQMNELMDKFNSHDVYVSVTKEGKTLGKLSDISVEYNNNNTQTLKFWFGTEEAGNRFSYDLPQGVSYDKSLTVTDNADMIAEKIGFGREGLNTLGQKAAKIIKTGIGTLFSLAFLGLSVYSIYCSVMEIYKYYHADMTKVPKYVVDRADLTETDANGNTVIRRNDSAYYRAITSNRSDKHEFFETMQDYGDVNAAEGKQWLVLYTNSNLMVKAPVLADSLKVVTGKSDMPEGYSTGIHLFGESIAVNMTDKKYNYDDKLNGIYVYFKNEPASSTSTGTAAQNNRNDAPATSSSFGFGSYALAGIGGMIVGFAVCLLLAMMIIRKRESETAKKSDTQKK